MSYCFEGDIVALAQNRHIQAIIRGITFDNGMPKYRVEFLNVPKKREFYYVDVLKAPPRIRP